MRSQACRYSTVDLNQPATIKCSASSTCRITVAIQLVTRLSSKLTRHTGLTLVPIVTMGWPDA